MTTEATIKATEEARPETITLRLLKLASRKARIERRDGLCRISDDRGRSLELPGAIVDRAVSDGLVEEREGKLTMRPEGRAFLKRALAKQGLGDAGAFAAQHGTLIRLSSEAGASKAPLFNLTESPLAALTRLKGKDGAPFLDDATIAAGERLRADFTRGQMQPRITANWEAGVARGPRGARNAAADLSDTALAARMRVDGAVKAIGPDLGGVVLDVCCFLKGLEAVERERQWPARSAKLMLRTGLRSLARHYGLTR
jgi:hypothetical protein